MQWRITFRIIPELIQLVGVDADLFVKLLYQKNIESINVIENGWA